MDKGSWENEDKITPFLRSHGKTYFTNIELVDADLDRTGFDIVSKEMVVMSSVWDIGSQRVGELWDFIWKEQGNEQSGHRNS